MSFIIIVLLMIGAGLIQTSPLIGAGVMIAAILLGDKLERATGGDDWLVSIIFLMAIVYALIMAVWGLLTL